LLQRYGYRKQIVLGQVDGKFVQTLW